MKIIGACPFGSGFTLQVLAVFSLENIFIPAVGFPLQSFTQEKKMQPAI